MRSGLIISSLLMVSVSFSTSSRKMWAEFFDVFVAEAVRLQLSLLHHKQRQHIAGDVHCGFRQIVCFVNYQE